MERRYISDITVRPIQSMGGDHMVVAAAKVSTNGEAALHWGLAENVEECRGLINYLVKHRHGTPFEHSALTMFCHVPIFVWREWHRHRIGFSYNEESGRYKQLEPTFYVPAKDRPMFKVDDWKPGRPKFMTIEEYAHALLDSSAGPEDKTLELCLEVANKQHEQLCINLVESYDFSYTKYEENLGMNFDPGIARACLPVGIYSSCWVTCNPRSLMAFLSLRHHDPEATFVSYPLYEIDVAAQVAEKFLEEGWPITYEAFIRNGRVAP